MSPVRHVADREPPRRTGRWGIGAVLGAASGLAPHLLHHAGLFAGTALLAGLGGTVLFGVLGVAAMTPMLLRLRRRFGTWWAPGVALLLFAVMFVVSTLVIGPALRDSGEVTRPEGEHSRHHG
jgi:hypothetical protein